MILKRQRLLYNKGIVGKEIFMFTANSIVKNNGALIMGAGCARTVRDTFKGIDKLFGDKIKSGEDFNVTFVNYNSQWIGAFQTKLDWRNSSPIDLVRRSILKLYNIAAKRPDWTFHLPCPAVNHGGKSVEEILPMLEPLPDNVIIYLE